MLTYVNYMHQLNQALKNTVATSTEGTIVSTTKAIELWCQMTNDLNKKNKTMFFIGNGASAMMAGHMAADACKNGGFRALAFNDPALLTTISNDISYEQSFAIPLKRFANSGDILVSISSSGNSPNIIAVIKAAIEYKLNVITLSGMNPDNKSRQLGVLNIYVPSDTYGLVEAAHQAILHYWLDLYMAINTEDNNA